MCNTDTSIQLHIYEHIDTDTEIQICKKFILYRCRDTEINTGKEIKIMRGRLTVDSVEVDRNTFLA